MDRTDQVVKTLVEAGLVNDEAAARSVVAPLLHDDYIPGGGQARTIDSDVKPAPVDARCGFAVGNDIQSGPIYCGDPATVCFESNNEKGPGLACACQRHASMLRRIAEMLKARQSKKP